MIIYVGRHVCRRILLDGLVESASSTAVQVLCAMLKKGQVEPSQAEAWFSSFPNTELVSQEALIAVKVHRLIGFIK